MLLWLILLVSGSQDEHIKFWKILTPDYVKHQTVAQYISNKTNNDQNGNRNSLINSPILFVKHFSANLGLAILNTWLVFML